MRKFSMLGRQNLETSLEDIFGNISIFGKQKQSSPFLDDVQNRLYIGSMLRILYKVYLIILLLLFLTPAKRIYKTVCSMLLILYIVYFFIYYFFVP